MSTFLMIGKVLQRTCTKLPSTFGLQAVNGSVIPLGILSPIHSHLLTQTRCYAARKGTREKARKLKQARKLREVKKELLPEPVKRYGSKVQAKTRERTNLYHLTREPIDDVWQRLHHKRQIFPILEAIEMHRELHHPTMLNLPDAPLYLMLELDMSLEKKTKFIDAFSGIVSNPHYFSDGRDRTIMAFCKNEQGVSDAIAAGANVAGGTSLIKQVLSGEVIASEYEYVVAHPDIINDLSTLRGILKKRYPTPAKGCMGVNMYTLVERFKLGIEYSVEKDSVHHNFGFTEINVGPLSMPAEHLQGNIGTVIEHVCTQRPSRLGPFISIALLMCPPSKEQYLIDVSKYMPSMPVEEDDDDDDEVAAKS